MGGDAHTVIMRILFFTHYFPPEGNAPATRVFQMARRWVRAGHEVQVITGVPNVPTGKPYAGYRNQLYQVEVLEGIRVRRVWTCLAPNKAVVRRSLNYGSYFFSALVAGLCGPRPDIIVATSPQFLCGCAGATLAKIRRIPFVLEIRDLWPESISAVGAVQKKGVLRALERIERALYRSAARIVTVGEGYRDRLIERGVAPEKIAIIPNAPDVSVFAPRTPDETLRAEYGLIGRKICAYVGTIGMASGLQVVVQAAQQLKRANRNDWVFWLVGDGAIREELERETRVHDLTDYIRFAGLQPKDRIPNFLATADVCLVHLRRQPLFRSVLPSKMLEAAAMAKPIVLGVEGYAADLLRRMGAGIVIEPENETQLLAALDRFASDPIYSRRCGESGRSYVLEHFNLDRLATVYESLLRDLCAQAPSGTEVKNP